MARFSAVRRQNRLRPGRIVLALLSAVVLAVTGLAWHGFDSLVSRLERLGGLGLGGGARDGATDILVVGVDSRTDAHGTPLSATELARMHAGTDEPSTNTDTILLIRVPNDGSSAIAVSIPRDAYVEIPGIGKAKINSAYGSTREARRLALVKAGNTAADAARQADLAGRQALIDTVSGLTGVTVDHYAEIGLLGFVLLTDTVGGVEVCLNQPVSEPLSGAHFPAGPQTLDGARGLSFVRQRHGLPRGDLDRIVRQQVFMASLTHQVLSARTLSSPSKLGELSDALTRSVVLDSDWDVLKFAKQLQNLSGGKVAFRTIPVTDGNASNEEGQSVVAVEPTVVHAFMSDLVASHNIRVGRSTVDPGSVTVAVANDSAIDGLASRVSDALTAKGFQRGAIGNHTGAEVDVSAVYAADTDDADAAAVAAALGGLPVRADTVPPGTVRVVLADDYTGPGASDAPASTSAPAPSATPIDAGRTGPRCVN